MRVFVELNDRVKEVEAGSVSELRVEIVKSLSVDITRFEMRSAGAPVDDGFALQPDILVHLVAREDAKGALSESPAQTSAENWKALFDLALAADDLVGKALGFAVDNSDGLIASAQALLARFGLETEFGKMSPAQIKGRLHELLGAALGDAEETEEMEEGEEESEPAEKGDKE